MIVWMLTVMGCGSSDIAEAPQDSPCSYTGKPLFYEESPPFSAELTTNDEGEADLSPDDLLPRRDNRRMDIDQLRASILQITGIEWTEGAGTSGQEQLAVLSDTLGVPDYRNSVMEDVTPSLVYEKFLGDAAASVCTKIIDQQSTLFFYNVTVLDIWSSNPQAIEDNIQHQLLRYHGRDYPSGDPEINHWEWLWRTIYAQTTGSTEERTSMAWRGICVALIIHPHFSTY